MFREQAKAKIENELARGESARRDGFEGRARVCARRAAGAAVREYLSLRGLPLPGESAYDLLAGLRSLPGMSEEVRAAAEHLMARVDEGFALPAEIDLLADARWLAGELERDA
jgi:hypothetical protein